MIVEENPPAGYDILRTGGNQWSAWGWRWRSPWGGIVITNGMATRTAACLDAYRHYTNRLELRDLPRTIARIQQIVGRSYGCTREEILSRKRSGTLVPARHVACYVARRLTEASYPQLGRLFRRDHTSVLSAVKKITKDPPEDLWAIIVDVADKLQISHAEARREP